MTVLAVWPGVNETGVRGQGSHLTIGGIIRNRRRAQVQVTGIVPNVIPARLVEAIRIDVQGGTQRVRPTVSPRAVRVPICYRKISGQVESLDVRSGEDRQ